MAFLAFLVYADGVSGTRKLRVDGERIVVCRCNEAPFLDYVDAEGIVQPFLTIKLNSLESGIVKQIVAEEAMLNKGDIILELQNQNWSVIEEQQDEWEKQRILYEEKRWKWSKNQYFYVSNHYKHDMS